MTETQELAKSLNMNEKELIEYVRTIGRVLNENFMRDVFEEKITLKDAITESVKLWDKKCIDAATQLLSGRCDGNGIPDKINQFAEAALDVVYYGLRGESNPSI